MIPLFNINGHELTSLQGEVSSFVEILPPDLEGMSEVDQERIIMDLEHDLTKNDGSLKIYWLNERLFFNAFSEITLTHGEIHPHNHPVSTFLGVSEAKIHFYENYLTCGTEYVRLLSVRDFPEKLSFQEVLKFPDFILNLKKVSKIEAKNKINLKRKLHFSSLFKGMRDLDSENAYFEAERLLDEIGTDSKALFDCEFYFLLKDKTKEKLDKITEITMKNFKGKNGALMIEEKGLSYLYQSLIPGVQGSFKRKIQLPSDFVSYLIPFQRDHILHEGLELKSRSDKSVFVDIFYEGALNYNALITGASGQGKSMLANKILMHELARGTKAMILDLGNSFHKNALYHGGVVLSEKFNPLQFKNPRYLKEFVLAVMDEKLLKKEEGRLFEVISSGEFQNFEGFLKLLEEHFPGISFYFKEIQEYFTDEVLPLHSFNYCDFTLYPDNLKAPLIIYLIEYFKNLQGRKVFIFDECWHLLQKNADYIAECFRTFRKHQASAIAISQNLDDFSESQLGRVIIQNTFFKFLFKQALMESEFIDAISKSLLDEIQSKKGVYSEFLYLTESHKKPLRFRPSPLEYELFTSDRGDINQFDSYMRDKGRFLDFKDAIHNFTVIKNPHWSFHE